MYKCPVACTFATIVVRVYKATVYGVGQYGRQFRHNLDAASAHCSALPYGRTLQPTGTALPLLEICRGPARLLREPAPTRPERALAPNSPLTYGAVGPSGGHRQRARRERLKRAHGAVASTRRAGRPRAHLNIGSGQRHGYVRRLGHLVARRERSTEPSAAARWRALLRAGLV